ncbi:MAG: GNAT family N-acetyltransferase [Deltaproteobacteria bacterium]|nr:GNAT family N-acetyltransferase [Deltaproteobacteria bacterium]
MEIRSANIEDLESLMGITQRCIKNLDGQGVFQWDEIYPSKKDFESDIAVKCLYVVYSNPGKNISGCICINETEYPGYEKTNWAGSKFFVIHKIMVDPVFENQGIGKAAMYFAEEFARSKRKDSIRLDCFQKNPRANRFYRRLGYMVKGETLFRKGVFNLYEKII